MTQREQIKQQIRELLQGETSGIRLSNRLFAPDGLFNQIATTDAERRALVQTPLFREAQTRLSELQRKEAADFSRVVAQVEAARGKDFLFKLEGTERP